MECVLKKICVLIWCKININVYVIVLLVIRNIYNCKDYNYMYDVFLNYSAFLFFFFFNY